MAAPPTEFKKGDTVEGYKVLSPLGAGAASLVYLVQEGNKQIWALKHVHREGHKDLRFVEQAEHEYEVASELDHPAIRKIVKLIRQKAGLLRLHGVILIMEFVDGISMEKMPPRHNLDLAVDLFTQTAEALQHMHQHGWVHADMKPNNIMICNGRDVKLIDLGQSCRVNTVKPRIQGTPDYIAPEQVHRRPITPQTDIYNLGATIYWVLTGEFIPTALAKGDSLVDKLDDKLMARPRPPVEYNPAIPPRLNELILRCVEVDPEKRPANMNEVIAQLQISLGLIRAKKNQEASARSGAPIAAANNQSGGSRAGASLSGQSGAGIRLGNGNGGSGASGGGMLLNDDSGDPIPVKPVK